LLLLVKAEVEDTTSALVDKNHGTNAQVVLLW